MNITVLTTSKSALFVLCIYVLCCYSSVVGLLQMIGQLQHSLFPLWPLCWYVNNFTACIQVHLISVG